MVRLSRGGLALALALLLGPRPAAAQSADTLRVTGDVGVVNAAGNTQLTTVNVGQELRWRTGPLTLGQTFAVVYGRTDGETTSSLWRSGARAEYALSPGVSVYGSVAYDRDRFAGIARRLEEGAGIGLGLLRRTRDRLEAKAGLSLVQQRSTAGADDTFAAASGGFSYAHQLGEAASLRQKVEGLANLEDASDFRLTSESALIAPLSRRLALKISYEVRFDNQPEPGFRSTDRLLTSGLQFTL